MKIWVYGLFLFFGVGLLFALFFTMLLDRPHAVNDAAISFETPPTAEMLHNGEYQFKVRCVSCHGMKGEGSRMAPALNDGQWQVSDGSLDAIYRVISEGSPSRAMKGWGGKLRPEDIRDISYYVKKLSD